jgi:hypothetical protein
MDIETLKPAGLVAIGAKEIDSTVEQGKQFRAAAFVLCHPTSTCPARESLSPPPVERLF